MRTVIRFIVLATLLPLVPLSWATEDESGDGFDKVEGHPQKEEDVRGWCGENSMHQVGFRDCVATEAKDSATYLEQAKQTLRAAIENGYWNTADGYPRTALADLAKANKAFDNYRDSVCRLSKNLVGAHPRFPTLALNSCIAALNNRHAADLLHEAGMIQPKSDEFKNLTPGSCASMGLKADTCSEYSPKDKP
jgi:hypothetical protein